LDIYDLNLERDVLTIRSGKGNKDRVVPIGKRAIQWIEKWLSDIRPDLANENSDQSLFLSKNGRRLGPNYVSNRVNRYLKSIDIHYRGSSHLLRHTAATFTEKRTLRNQPFNFDLQKYKRSFSSRTFNRESGNASSSR